MYSKQAFASHTSDNTIHLYNSRLRLCFKKLLEISIASTNTTSSVYLEFRLFVSRAILYFTRQINVTDIKKLGINIVIQCFFTAHDFINILYINLMKRLSIFNQGADDSVDSCYIILIG